LFYGYVFSRFGKLPIFGRFVPQIISPIHVAASSTPEDAGGHSRTGLSPLTAIRNPRSPDYLHAPVRQEIIPPEHTPSAVSSWSGTRQVLYSITKHAMRRSADEIGATSISFRPKVFSDPASVVD
jgi:hypothetical protein